MRNAADGEQDTLAEPAVARRIAWATLAFRTLAKRPGTHAHDSPKSLRRCVRSLGSGGPRAQTKKTAAAAFFNRYALWRVVEKGSRILIICA